MSVNAGKYRHPIKVCHVVRTYSTNGFPVENLATILNTRAEVKTTKGMTLIANDTDFEKAYTRFTIRYPRHIQITRDMFVVFDGQQYSIEYLNNVNEDGKELEMQCKLVDINKDGKV